MGMDGKKLSKRRGAKSVLDIKKEGILSGALLNYLMLLGWSPKDNREILSIDEIEKDFSLTNINSAPAIFDERKLNWMNGEYIKKSQISNLKNQILEIDPELKEFDQELLEKLIEPSKTRMKSLLEFRTLITPFVTENKTPSSELKSSLFQSLQTLDKWDLGSILDEIKKTLDDKKLHFPDLYEAVIGERQGLPLADVFEIIGKEKTLTLLK